MTFVQNLLHLTHAHMRINLGSADIVVTQHLLNHPDVRSMIHEVRCKGMSEQLWVDMDTNPKPNSHEHTPNRYTTQWFLPNGYISNGFCYLAPKPLHCLSVSEFLPRGNAPMNTHRPSFFLVDFVVAGSPSAIRASIKFQFSGQAASDK